MRSRSFAIAWLRSATEKNLSWRSTAISQRSDRSAATSTFFMSRAL